MGAVEVATLAIKDIPTTIEWYTKRADAYLILSRKFKATLDTDAALENISNCLSDMGDAVKCSKEFERRELLDRLQQVADEADILARQQLYGSRFKDIFDISAKAIQLGDMRLIAFRRLIAVIQATLDSFSKSGRPSTKQVNLIEQMLREGTTLLNKLIQPSSSPEESILAQESLKSLDSIAATFSKLNAI
jgi:hypothetical protein